MAATGGTLLLVEILKFIHSQDQELFVYLVQVILQVQITVDYLVIAGGGGGGGAPSDGSWWRWWSWRI